MKKKDKHSYIRTLLMFGVWGFFVLASYFQLFYRMDRIVMDTIYQRPDVAKQTIKIIAIDEKTLNGLGPIGNWQRDVYAQVITQLNSRKDARPEIIAFDITFNGKKEDKEDQMFVLASKQAGNVIVANDVVFEQAFVDGKIDPFYIDRIEQPYDDLYAVTKQGFSDTLIDHDGKIRSALLEVEKDGVNYPSFSYQIAKSYAENHGFMIQKPKLDAQGSYGFTYTTAFGGYETISLLDVLQGRIDQRIFKDCIVLVGAYSSGMQDNYFVPVDNNEQMYGVEIQANIIQALLEQKTFLSLSPLLNCLYVGIVSAIGIYLISKTNMVFGACLLGVFSVLDVLFGRWLYANGKELQIASVLLSLFVLYVVHVIVGYVQERKRKQEIVSTFKKYVAPQVVEEIMKLDNVEQFIEGRCKDIAVMFVDIRGFTPLSEKLSATKVVEILNIYLEMTTRAIFEQKGTLDKFIGDATMAVFNSPFDLDDYVYRAVASAYAIAEKSEEISKNIEEIYGMKIGFGVGVNCGEAVIGNIGSNMRMNFTAIGDVVNTAARLEGQAKAGQVLISTEVYERLKGRIETKEVGRMTLKGKQEALMVYEVCGLKGR